MIFSKNAEDFLNTLYIIIIVMIIIIVLIIISVVAEEKKKRKYSSLSGSYLFTPIAVETLGPWGPEAIGFVTELGRRLITVTGDPRSGAFLKQKISIAVQRGNASCILGSFPRGSGISEDFYT